MLPKWALRTLIFAGSVIALFLVLAFTLQVPAVGKTIGSPAACGTCHVMDSEVKSLSVSAHRDLSCLDCHAANGFIKRPVEELKSSARHVFLFVTNSTPDVIKPTHESREIVQENCVNCHAPTLGKTHVTQPEWGRNCFDCHREVPHGTPRRN